MEEKHTEFAISGISEKSNARTRPIRVKNYIRAANRLETMNDYTSG
jgi:hypothetical protein